MLEGAASSAGPRCCGCTFLLTCVPTEGGFNTCVPVFFGAFGLRGGAILWVPFCTDFAFSLWVVMAAITSTCCEAGFIVKGNGGSLRPAKGFWSRRLCPIPTCTGMPDPLTALIIDNKKGASQCGICENTKDYRWG